MNKTLYIKNSDTVVWDRAKRIAVLRGFAGIGEYIVDLLRKDAEAIGTEKLQAAERLLAEAGELMDVDGAGR